MSTQSDTPRTDAEVVLAIRNNRAFDADVARQLERELTESRASNEVLRKALQHYADRTMWRKEVIDSMSGECDFFDWPGELGDNGYDIAEEALKNTEPKG